MTAGVAIFFSMFMIISGLMNFIVLYFIANAIGLHIGLLFWAWLILLSASFITSSMLASRSKGMLTRIYYILSSYWLGFVFISIMIILLYTIIFIVFPASYDTYSIFALALSLIISIYASVNALRISVRKVSIYSPKINSSVRIVQISDLHLGSIYSRSYVKKVVEKTNSLKPDLVVITGDLIDGRHKFDNSMFEIFNDIHAEIIMITGNHEGYAGIEYFKDLISRTKIRLLRNESVDAAGMTVIGIDDSEDSRQVQNVIHGIKLDKTRYNLLLYHRPIGYRFAARHVDFMLSGHTHAGQIWPFTYLSKMANDGALHGLYQELGRDFLYVSPGTGTWGPRMRLGSANEITLIEFEHR